MDRRRTIASPWRIRRLFFAALQDRNKFCLSRFFSSKGLLVETDMKIIGVALFALSVASFGMANVTMAQDATVIHKESADGDRSKTIVKHDDGSKTVIKRHGDRVKKIHTAANGDKTIVKKTTY
jgi:hypothetical protein